MSVKWTEVEVTNKTSLNGLLLDCADFLREMADNGVILEAYSYNDLFSEQRVIRFREVAE